MKSILIAAASLAAAGLAMPVAASDPQEKYERKGPREWVYEYQNGHRVVKEERKGREYKYESRHGDRERKYERKADGSWKEEIKDGNCVIKRERTANGEYKRERSC